MDSKSTIQDSWLLEIQVKSDRLLEPARAPVGNFAVVIASDAFSSGIFEGFNSKAKVTIRKT